MVNHRKGVRKAGWRQIGRGQWVTTGRQARRAGKRRAFRAGYDRTGGYYGGGRRMLPTELKFHDVDLDDAVIAGPGTITPSINLIAQGATESQRIGRKCVLKSIMWKYRMSLPEVDAAGTFGPSDLVRVIMYLDKQCNGATAAVTDILESDDFQSFNNLANKNRFVKLMDKSYTFNYQAGGSDGAGVISGAQVDMNETFYHKCNIPLEFDAATGAITEIRSNNIGVLLLSRNGVCAFGSKIRLRFEG